MLLNTLWICFTNCTLGLGGKTIMLIKKAEMMPTSVNRNRLSAKCQSPEASIMETTVTSVSPTVSPMFNFKQIMMTSTMIRPTAIGSLDNTMPPIRATMAPSVVVCSWSRKYFHDL
ncbi:hypothetical protein D1872_259520 [compost metagenome]